MKQKNVKQYAGVCMDNANAIIISRDADATLPDFDIREKVKAGGARSGGSEHSMNNAQHTDELKYFKSVAAHLLPFDEILIFGTGQAQEQFQNYLKKDGQFSSKQITIDTAEHLTDPQMIAKVRDFFKTS
jgi:hypothetical protein